MTNILLDLIEHKIQHFVTKSYITCGFEKDECRTEYYVYFKIHEDSKVRSSNAKHLSPDKLVGFYNKRSKDFPYLKFKKLQKKELKFFRENCSLYEIPYEDKDGSVSIHKQIGFTKEKSPQISLWRE
jgi:hypothetical protein